LNKKLLFSGIGLLIVSVILLLAQFLLKPPPSKLDIKIKVKPAVMPIVYKVYGNPKVFDGRFWLAKVTMTNTGKTEIKNLKISYHVPSYVDWTTPTVYEEVLPGQTIIDRFYPQFPPKIMDVMNPTPSSVEIKITYNNGRKTVEEIKKIPFQIRGRNEFIYTDLPQSEIADVTDLYDNAPLLAAFVTPEDPVIKYFTQQLQQKILKGTVAGVVNNQKEILRFMKGLYEFELKSGMVYGGTLGLPEKVGKSYTIIQRIRLPREVLTGGAGLCIELSTLFCSVAMSAGLDCGIFLTSRHAWPAIIAGGSIYPIESTGIGGKGIGGSLSFEKALQLGMENVKVWSAGGDNKIGVQIGFLDISKLQSEGIRPPALRDDPNLRKKIDELISKALGSSGYKRKTAGRISRRTTYRSTSRRTSAYSNFRRYSGPNGIFSVMLPRNWNVTSYPLGNANPYLVLGAISPTSTLGFEAFVFPGIGSPEAAMAQEASLISAMGGLVTYQRVGTVRIGGRNYVKFVGRTVFPQLGTTSNWEAYFTVTPTGVVGFDVAVTTGTVGMYRNLFSVIINSFRVAS
jgi:hypothetical protein